MDIIEYIVTHNTKLNFLKNSLQFLVGASMVYALGQHSDYTKLILPLVGLVLAYQSVYRLNDIFDFSEDSKNQFKRNLKPFARGETSLETEVSKMFLYMLLGLSISFYVSTLFGLLVTAMLILNFFHSYKPLNIKRTPIGIVNIFLIEFIKFSCGWFALGGNFQSFPYFITAFMSSAYALGYHSYKNDLNMRAVQKKRFMILFAATSIFYLLSIFIYKEFRISMVAMLPAFILLFLVKSGKSGIQKIITGAPVVVGVMAAVVVLNFLLPYEPIHSINIWLGNLF